jgi:hypothetical protein
MSGKKPNGKTMTAEEAGVPSQAAAYMKSLEDEDTVESCRCVITEAHVFKLPPNPTAGGWRGADWADEVWQGTVKVVERGEMTLVLLVDRVSGAIFAVCPIKDGAVDRCVDSSRYFVLRIENANGRHMFIGMAFNERNDAFDFNTSLEDAKRERLAAKNPVEQLPGLNKDYSIKEGEKIRVKIKNLGGKLMLGLNRGTVRYSFMGQSIHVTCSCFFLSPQVKEIEAKGNQKVVEAIKRLEDLFSNHLLRIPLVERTRADLGKFLVAGMAGCPCYCFRDSHSRLFIYYFFLSCV